MNKQEYKKAIKSHGTTILVIVAALVFTVSVVVIKKSYDNFTEYRELTRHESQVLETLETNRENLEQLQTRSEELEEEGIPSEAVLSLMRLRYHPVADFAMFEQLTDISSVDIQDVRATESTEAGAASEGLTPYRVTVSVQGSYSELKDFYTRIEESAQPLIVSELNINSESGGAVTGDEQSSGGAGSSGSSLTSEVKIILHHQGGDETGEASLEGGAPSGDIPGEGVPGNGGEVLE